MVVARYFLQWMLKIIQIKLIHILGGRTIEEIDKFSEYYKYKGYLYAYWEMRNYCKSLNGLSKQKWIDKVWNIINDKVYDKQ